MKNNDKRFDAFREEMKGEGLSNSEINGLIEELGESLLPKNKVTKKDSKTYKKEMEEMGYSGRELERMVWMYENPEAVQEAIIKHNIEKEEKKVKKEQEEKEKQERVERIESILRPVYNVLWSIWAGFLFLTSFYPYKKQINVILDGIIRFFTTITIIALVSFNDKQLKWWVSRKSKEWGWDFNTLDDMVMWTMGFVILQLIISMFFMNGIGWKKRVVEYNGLFPTSPRYNSTGYRNIDSALNYRESVMGSMNQKGKMKLLAETGFLGSGSQEGFGQNSREAMEYLDAELGAYNQSGQLEFLRNFYKGKK